MKLTAQNETTTARIDKGERFGTALTKFILRCSGRKKFTSDGRGYWFETTQRNIEMWLELFPDCVFVDERVKSRVLSDDIFMNARPKRPPFVMGSDPYAHQARGFEKLKDLELSAIYMGTGTGKTKMAIDKSMYWWCMGKIDGCLVLTKKGVHEQWVEEQFPDHIHPSLPWMAHAWDKMKTVTEQKAFKRLLETPKMRFFTMNIDAIRTKSGFQHAQDFIRRCGGRVYFVIDECQDINDPEGSRNAALQELRDDVICRSIMSGTPIATSLMDVWGQFHFLDVDVIGHKYKAAFRAEYCNMGGFEGKQIISHKNIEKFYARIDPMVFRATKEEDLDLPEKVYKKEYFKMTDKQFSIYDKLRREFLVRLDNGQIATVEHAATCIMRLQQIACGFIVDENDGINLLDNPRMDRLVELDETIGVHEKKIIWCRFHQDYDVLMKQFGKRAVDYTGKTSDEDRARNKKLFLDPKSGKDILISNTAAGGTGLNLQGECAYALYYSNSFNSIHREQSEDRIHRIGTYKTTYFIDLVASKSVDVRILSNLQKKKDFSTFVMDDVRHLFEEAGHQFAEAA
jgi:hypothetical protein